MPELNDEAAHARRGRRRDVARDMGRAIGDASLTAGMARGVTGRGVRDDGLLANSALQSEGANLQDDARVRPGGLLDRVPGWLILAILLAIVGGVLVFTTWQ
jgi:hypothetical protein